MDSKLENSLKILLLCREAKASVTTLLSPAVPQVVRSCAEFILKHGVVDGIYRLSGISSNIQKLRLLIPYSFRADLLQHPQSGVIVFVTFDHISSVIRTIYRQLFDSPSSSILPGTSLTLSRSQT